MAYIGIIDYKAGNSPSVLNALQRLNIEARLLAAPENAGGSAGIILPGVGSARATMDSLRESGWIDFLNDSVLKKGLPFLGICVGLQILFEHSEEGDTLCLGWLKGQVKRFDSAKVRVPHIGWNLVRFADNAVHSPQCTVHSPQLKDNAQCTMHNAQLEDSAQCTAHSPQLKDKDDNFQLSTFNFQLLTGLPAESYFYFVNSYYAVPKDKSIILSMTEYTAETSTAVSFLAGQLSFDGQSVTGNLKEKCPKDYGGEFCSAVAYKNIIATQFHLEKSGEAGLEMLKNFAANALKKYKTV
ncbi:MAG: imidazole glycerol phosphate synthase subunit HisH [Clostridiales bacterium]|jgi:glutamine amidotransferase|nr:imidazole glycerol phosphate synthase subunit HisH [Clostridiales bacterium]